MKKVILCLLIFLFSIGTVSAFSLSGGGDWKYYKEITIKENSGKTLTDYQILVELNSANFDFSKAKSDGSDIRFSTDSQELSYWIEEWDSNAKKAKIWVKVPLIPANGETKIKMWYGNPSAGAVSDGDKVFEFFDNFEDDDISDWNIVYGSATCSDGVMRVEPTSEYCAWGEHPSGDPYLLKCALVYKNSNGYVGPLEVRFDFRLERIVYRQNNGCTLVYFLYQDSYDEMRVPLRGDYWQINLGGDSEDNVYRLDKRIQGNKPTYPFGNPHVTGDTYWHTAKIIRDQHGNWELYRDETKILSGSDPWLPKVSNKLYIFLPNAPTTYFDNIYIRKYTSPEPTLLFSQEYSTIAPTPPPAPVFVPYSNNPILSSHTVPPKSIFKLSDDEYHMFFVEQREDEDYPADFDADLLISSDGLNWDISSVHRNVISSQQSGHTFNYYVCVIKEGDEYKAWHSATSDWDIAGTKLYYSTSKDGIHYSGHGMVLDNGPYPEYDSRNINQPWIVFDGNIYHLYYSAYPGHQSGPPDRSYHWTIAYATSSDGIHWKKQGVVIDPGMSPAVVYDGTKFEMLYNVQNGDKVVVKYAVSYDGLNWEKIGEVNSIDGWVVGLAKENGIYKVWYRTKETVSGLFVHKLHYATAKEQYPQPQIITPTQTPKPTTPPPKPPEGKIKAIWLYNYDRYDLPTLVNDLKSAGINTIFLSTDVNNIWKYERFVKTAHENGIEVHAMILEIADNKEEGTYDFTNFYKNPYHKDEAVKDVEKILDYNEKSLAAFDGINIDIEPYTSDLWNSNREDVWNDYMEVINAIKEKINGRTKLSANILYDSRDYTEDRIKDLASALDFFVIMAYDSGGSGFNTPEEIKDAVAQEMGSIRGEGAKAVIGIGVHEGFGDKSDVENCINDLFDYYSDDPAFLGISIFRYYSYSELPETKKTPEENRQTGEEKEIPGFECIFAITLLAVAYMLKRLKK